MCVALSRRTRSSGWQLKKLDFENDKSIILNSKTSLVME